MGPEDETLAWIDRVNSRGVAGMFTDKTPEDKVRAEELQLRYLIDAMSNEFGVETEQFVPVQDDPPDFYVEQNGILRSVELVEFVNGAFLRKVAKGRLDGERYSAFQGEGFTNCQWGKDKFLAKLDELVIGKDTKYFERELSFDILAIVTDEEWLYRDEVKSWLSECYPLTDVRSFSEVYFVMDYDPNEPRGHPIFRLY